MTTTQPLAPIHACPWCNPDHAGLAPRVNTANGTQHWVFCPECGMHGPCGIGEAEAVERWNIVCSRTPSVLPGAVKDAAERAGEDCATALHEAFQHADGREIDFADIIAKHFVHLSPPSSVQAEAVAWMKVNESYDEFHGVTEYDAEFEFTPDCPGDGWKPLYASPIQAPGIVAELQKLVDKCKWEADKTSSQQFKLRTAYKWFASELSSLIKAVGEKP